jgi:anti-anti-sigma factor
MGLQLFVRNTSDVTIVDLQGRVTIGRANDLLRNQLRELIEKGTNKILLNLTGVTQLDSSSLGTIVNAFVSLKRRGGRAFRIQPATAAAKPSAASEIGDFRLFSLRSCSHTSADLRAVCSGWPELPEVASDVSTKIAEYVMGLALRAIDSAYRGAA